MGKHITGGKGG